MSKRPNSDLDKQRRIAFAGGYSAGHITPGLAIHERLHALSPNIEGFFIGPDEGPERAFVERESLSFVPIPVVSYSDRSFGGKGRSVRQMFLSLPQSRRVLRRERTDMLVTLGSYVGVAPSLAALTLGIPVVVFEPNCRFGLANKVCARIAKKVWLSQLWAGSRGSRSEIVGVPLRMGPERQTPQTYEREEGAPTRVLVLGGSRGHSHLNHNAPNLWAAIRDLGRRLEVTHVCGVDESAATVRRRYEELNLQARVEAYISPLLPTLAASDFVITSAGAISLHEIATLGIPPLVVPLKGSADNHQADNAKRFMNETHALVCSEEEWDTSRLAGQVHDLLNDPARCVALRDRMSRFNPVGPGWDRIQSSTLQLLDSL